MNVLLEGLITMGVLLLMIIMIYFFLWYFQNNEDINKERFAETIKEGEGE